MSQGLSIFCCVNETEQK